MTNWTEIEEWIALRDSATGENQQAIAAKLKELEAQIIEDYLAAPANCWSQDVKLGGFEATKGAPFYSSFDNLVVCSGMFRTQDPSYGTHEQTYTDRIGFVLKHRRRRAEIDESNRKYEEKQKQAEA